MASKKEKKTVCVLMKGSPYSFKMYDCYTLNAAIGKIGCKRSDIIDWWKEF